MKILTTSWVFLRKRVPTWVQGNPKGLIPKWGITGIHIEKRATKPHLCQQRELWRDEQKNIIIYNIRSLLYSTKAAFI